MIFHRIHITNLFAYYGEHNIDFMPAANGEGTLTLIYGRNGYGKTNILRAVKLLFLGSDDKTLRKGMARGNYILGDGSKWSGILNTRARDEGKSTCSVKVELGPSSGVTFTAERKWDLSGESFSPNDETLEVNVDGRSFAGDSAEARLNELLPRELVPFFFFDGEEIHYLADTSDVRRAEAMEQLLSLSFVNGVEDELDELIREWRRAELPSDIQAQIADEEGKRNGIDKHINADREKIDDLRQQLTEQNELSDDLRHRMDRLRQAGGFSSAGDLESHIATLESELQNKQDELAYALAADAPLLANPSLVRAAIEPLQSIVDRKSKAVGSVLDALFKGLPERLFQEPPQPEQPLSEVQQRFYQKKLRRILDSYEIDDYSEKEFLSGIDLMRARKLREEFLGLEASLKERRRRRAADLQEISKFKSQLEDKRAERREAEFGSSDVAAQYAELEEKYSNAQQEVGRIKSDIQKLESHIEDREKDRKAVSDRIKGLEHQAYTAAEASRKLEISSALRDSFRKYRKIRRQKKREQIEAVLNDYFNELMSGHRMVDRISVDEDFYLRFLDKNGRDIGHSTISHGMRQLAVTAMLWALKDVSGRALPIIVDTPLARIDRTNQENLLLHYYPNAAEQVIVLATDSEVDDRKFGLIRPNLVKAFKLENPSGDQAMLSEFDVSGDLPRQWGRVASG